MHRSHICTKSVSRIEVTSTFDILVPVPEQAPDFVRDVLGSMIAGNGDNLPVSALPPDGTFPTGHG